MRDEGMSVTTRHEGDSDASFVDFVRAHHTTLYRTALLLAGDAASAEDLVQDTLTTLYPRWWRVDAAREPLAYVRVCLTNTFINSRRLRSANELTLERLPDTGRTQDASDIATDRRFALQLLNHLNRRQRAAVVMSYFHDLDDEHIADALGCRPGTARSLISRGVAAMRAESRRMDAATMQGGTR